MQRQDIRHYDKSAQQALRKKAIEHWLESGRATTTGRELGIPIVTVRKWIGKYKAEGMSGLEGDSRGRPTGRELDPKKSAQIISLIVGKNPEQLKLPFALWTRENVANLIKRKYGIVRSPRQVGRYLAEWGFTPQKPIYRAYQQDDAQVRQWLKKDYPVIKRQAQRDGGSIFWGDETAFRSKDTRGRSFAPKGKTPVIPKTGHQFGVNMISAVSNQGKLHFMLFKGGINSDKFITFLKQAVRMSDRKLFLIVDNLPVHKTRKVRDWVSTNRHRISLHYLPPYSPELNPDEYLNQDLKASMAGTMSMVKSVDHLEKKVKSQMLRRKRSPQKVKNIFKHKKVSYAA
jgi:transposase